MQKGLLKKKIFAVFIAIMLFIVMPMNGVSAEMGLPLTEESQRESPQEETGQIEVTQPGEIQTEALQAGPEQTEVSQPEETQIELQQEELTEAQQAKMTQMETSQPEPEQTELPNEVPGQTESFQTETMQAETLVAEPEQILLKGQEFYTGTWICDRYDTGNGKYQDQVDGMPVEQYCQMGFFEDGTFILIKARSEYSGYWAETENGIELLLQINDKENLQFTLKISEMEEALFFQFPGEEAIFRLKKGQKTNLFLQADSITIQQGESAFTYKDDAASLGFPEDKYEVSVAMTDVNLQAPGEYSLIYKVIDLRINKKFFVDRPVIVTDIAETEKSAETVSQPESELVLEVLPEITKEFENEQAETEVQAELMELSMSDPDMETERMNETEEETEIETEEKKKTEVGDETETEDSTETEELMVELAETEEETGVPVETEGETDAPEETEKITDSSTETETEEIILGSIEIKAVDEISGKNAGAGFEYAIVAAENIVDSSGNIRIGKDSEGNTADLVEGTVVDIISTSEDGAAVSQKLYPGTYIVREERAAEYFALSGYAENVTVTGTVKKLSIGHSKTYIDVSKVDSEDGFKPLKGVTFRIFTDADVKPEKVKEYNNRISSFLENQNIALEEFLRGQEEEYQQLLQIQQESLDTYRAEGHSQAEIENFRNTQKKSLEQYETDAAQKKEEFIAKQEKSLAAFKSDLSESMNIHLDEIGKEYTTDADGFVRMENLKHGTAYYVLETKTVDGYNADQNIYEVYVDENGLIDGRSSYFLELSDTANVVKFYILDENGNLLSGAKMCITDLSGNEVHTWNTSKEPYGIIGLSAGTYYLKMLEAPTGYALSRKITFTVKNQLEVQDVTMVNKKIQVSFRLADANTHEAVKGAKLVVRNKLGKEVDNWITEGEEYILALSAGEYVLSQEKAVDGYATADPISFTVTAASSNQGICMEAVPLILSVSMMAEDGTDGELKGAVLMLLDGIGEEIDSWETGQVPHKISYLKTGDYVLHEKSAPDGYSIAKNMAISVKDVQGEQSAVMMSETIKVSVSLKEEGGSEELSGAEFVLLDDTGKEIDAWTTDGVVHTISKLCSGKYVLKEKAAPAGYVTGEDVTVTVTDAPGVQLAEVYNVPTVTEVSLKEEGSEQGISGAELSIIDAAGNIVEKWITDGKTHQIKKLAVGEYILRQMGSAQGYTIASDVPFTVIDSKDILSISMFNNVTRVEITLKNEKEELLGGAQLIIKDASGKEIDRFVTAEEAYLKEKLNQGEYILTEVSPCAGYVSAESVPFTVTDENAVLQVSMVNKLSCVEIAKKDLTNSRLLSGAALKILDSKGNTIEEWTSEENIHTVRGLPIGDYVLEETQAPAGFELSERMNFTVADTEEAQNFIMYNKPREGTTSLIGTKQLTSTTSLNGTTGGTWGGDQTWNDTETMSAVQTGDTAPIVEYLVLMAGAALFIGAIIYLQIKKRRK